MPTFELTAPDGGTYQIDAPDEHAAVAALGQLGGGVQPQDGSMSATNLARAAARGVPVVGGLLNKMEAATNAALAPAIEPFLTKGPNTLDQPTFGERYAKSLAIQQGMDKAFEQQHPIASTAAEIAGGTAALAPAVAAAPAAFGAAGTLPQMVARGAASGAALSAADAATRGQDPLEAAKEGAVLGAAAGPIGRGIGKIAASVSRETPALPPERIVRAAGVDIPTRPQDTAIASELEAIRRGGRGEPAQRVVEQIDQLANQRLAEASANVGSSLDRAGAAAATSPSDAAERVSSELAAAEARRFGTEQAANQRATQQGTELAASLRNHPNAVAETPYAAGEQIGTGVAGRAAQSKSAFKELYQKSAELPSDFAPSAFQDVGNVIRRRLSVGDQPVFVDSSTPFASRAMQDIERNVASGMFPNAAEPRVGLAGGMSEADAAKEKLVSMGVSPARADAAVAGLRDAQQIGGGHVSHTDVHQVSVPGGGSIDVMPFVVEARDPIVKTSADAGYDHSLQPRDRARAASTAQVNDMANNLNPQRLGFSTEADRGAPIVGPDGMVESGNGRVQAIRKAYQEGGPAADRYRAWLASQGVDLSKYKEPMLVRGRITQMSPEQRQAFTVAANKSSTLSMSAAERALSDARALPANTLSLIRNPGDLGAVENRDFVRSFIQRLPVEERAGMMTKTGDLATEGLTRIRNAVLARAYGDSPVLSRVAEATNDDIRSISRGLTEAAPQWAQMRAEIAAGRVPAEFDKTGDLLDAVSRTSQLRGKGVSLAHGTAQADAFSRATPESDAFQRLFYDADGAKAASSTKIADGLRTYAQEAMKVDASPGLDLGMRPVTPADVLNVAARHVQAPASLAADVQAEAQKAMESAAQSGRVVNLKQVDQARKRMVSILGDAKATRGVGAGMSADERAVRRIMAEFDNYVIETVDSPKYRGDPAALELLRKARAGVAEYARTFGEQGPGDEVGRAISKILGRYPGQAATPDEIARLSYGSVSDPGGGKAIRVAQRLRQILGPTSPEWGAYKQGLFSVLTRGADGGQLPMAKAAERIEKFLTGTNGRGLAQVAFEPSERAALANYAQSLRAAEPQAIRSSDMVEKVIARISGRDGGPPATTTEIADYLFGRSGAGDKGLSVRLAQRLKRDLTPEGWDGVRQGMWSKLTEAAEGKTAYGPQKISQRISEFLNGTGKPLAQVLFTADERAEMAALAKAFKLNAPIAGTTNPSGTAPMLARIGAKLLHTGLPVVGLAHGGVPGAVGGYLLDRGLTSASNQRAARLAARLYYGKNSAVADPRFAKAATLIGQGAAPRLVNGQP